MTIGLAELLIIAAIAALTALPWLVALVHASRRPDSQWAAADQSKPLWVLVIVVLGLMGLGIVAAGLYFSIPARALAQTRLVAARLTA